MVRFKCKNCHCRINAIVEFSRDNRFVKFSCPRCLCFGVFRNKDYIPVLFVKTIRIASRQYFAVIPSQPLKLRDARLVINPQKKNS